MSALPMSEIPADQAQKCLSPATVNQAKSCRFMTSNASISLRLHATLLA